jgi:hypothetical protein
LLFVSATNFESYYTRFAVLGSEAKEISAHLAEACVNTAILRLAQNQTYSVVPQGQHIPVGDRECMINSITSGVFPSERIIRVTGIHDTAHTHLEVEIDTGTLPTITIMKWEEKPIF